VKLTGLAPGSTVTVHARNLGYDGLGYEAYATFTSGADGSVDVASAAPSSGTYQGVDPDGLIWSGQLRPEPSNMSAWAANPLTLFFTAVVDGTTVAPRHGVRPPGSTPCEAR
jgi:hypothetical protein